MNGTTSHGNAAFADWPCSSIHFQVEVQCSSSPYVEALMYNLRTRMVVKIASLSDNDGTTPKEQYILGPSFSTSPPGTDILDFPQTIKIDLECNEEESKMRQRMKWLVSLIKLSEAEPYAPGIGNDILGPRYSHKYISNYYRDEFELEFSGSSEPEL